MVDDIQQNQGSQGHGQGYLGSLKALSPELIQDVTIINGPFSPEYGDFSGLGVVHIHQRESLPEQFTVRLQGGNFDTGRGFLTNRDYYETQNYFESRVSPAAPIIARIHATPAYPFTAVAGVTFRLRAKD